MKAGVIGLGEIGGGVARCLARAGCLGAVYDVRPDAAAGIEGAPPLAASPADMARQCDVPIIAVVDAAQCRAVLDGPDGLLAGAMPGTSIVLLATLGLDDLREIWQLTDAAGVTLLDCGVVGGRKAGENGLICLVGADEREVAALQTIFEGFARYAEPMGRRGSGMTAKLIYNTIYIASLRAGLEGARLAHAADIDIRKLSRVFRDSADSVGGPLLFAAGPGEGVSSAAWRARREQLLPMMIKDLEAALDLARLLAVDMEMVTFARATAREIIGLDD